MTEEAVHPRLKVGMPAPNLTLVDVKNQPINLADLWPTGSTLLTFSTPTIVNMRETIPRSRISFLLLTH